MELFGVGGFEFALVIIIALIVAGPARMAVWARKLGQWTAQLRNLWRTAAVQLQRELDDAGVDFKVPKELPTRRAIVDEINRSSTVKELSKPIKEVQAALEEGKSAAKEVTGALSSVERKMLEAAADSNPSLSPGESPTPTARPVFPQSTKPVVPSTKPAAGTVPAVDGFGSWGSADDDAKPKQNKFGSWSQAPKDE